MSEKETTATERLLEEAQDSSTRFLSAAILIGRRVAGADDIVEEEEEEELVEAFRERLHLGESATDVIRALLDEAVEGEVTVEFDRDAITDLTCDIDSEAAKLNLFAFGCRIAAADDEFQHAEKELLSELATILGIGTTSKNVLLRQLVGGDVSTDVNGETVHSTAQKMEAAKIQGEYSRDIIELAMDHVRLLEKSYEESAPDQTDKDSAGDKGRTISGIGRADREFSSKIRGELEASPLRKELEECLVETLEFPDSIIGEERRSRLQRLLERAEDEQFRIAVVGNFSSGKSTMLNALCRDAEGELFPTSTNPCTGAVSVLRHNDERRFFAREADGTEREVAEEDLHEEISLPADIERCEALRKSDTEAMVVEYPLPLCKGGVELIDTPGLNENPRRSEITQRYVTKADAVVYMVSATQPFGSDEREFIEQQLLERLNPENLFFVVNYWDQVGEEERADVKRRIRSVVEEIYPSELNGSVEDRVHYLSAKKVLDHESDGREDSEYIAAFEEFERTVGSFLAESKGEARWRRKADELMRELVHIQDNAEAQAEVEFDDLDARIRAKEKALAQFEQSRKKLERRKAEVSECIENVNRRVVDNLRESLERYQGKIPKLMRSRSKEWETDASPLLGKDEIKEDYEEQLKDDLQFIFEEWAREQGERQFKQGFRALREQLNEEFKAINEEIAELEKVAEQDVKLPDDAGDGDEGAFQKFMKGAGGWAAGGPIGALVGAQLELEDLAMNAAANFAYGWALGIFGIGGPWTLIIGVAVIGVWQLWEGQDKILDKIRTSILDEAEDKLPEVVKEAKSRIDEKVRETFGKIESEIHSAMDSKIEEIQLKLLEEKKLLEKAKNDRQAAKEERQEWLETANEVEAVGSELVSVSNISFEAARREYESAGDSADAEQDSRTESEKKGKSDPGSLNSPGGGGESEGVGDESGQGGELRVSGGQSGGIWKGFAVVLCLAAAAGLALYFVVV